MESTALTGSFLVGVATGGRSMTGLAAVALTTEPTRADRLLDRVATTRGRVLLTAGAAAEMVGDKLPTVPSRLSRQGLTSRIAAGALAGAALAVRSGGNPGLGALAGVTGSVVGSYAGATWRRWAGTEKATAFTAAVTEDLLTVAVALLACGLASQRGTGS
ncbi:hypothetical protein AB0J74_33975 [Asanoa sp. NPDC049573]|uniref:hypothetical protein n=1 Tax=Asanoa sp. NPDC049573 TaxID=3155396 RepID=UPI00343C013C